MSDYGVVYTVSDKGNMIRDLLKSLKSITRYVDTKDINVFYTPPRCSVNRNKIRKYARVKYCQHLCEPFEFHKGQPGYYGDKLWMCMMPHKNIVFLDCDTIVNTDFVKYVELGIDFMARVGTGKVKYEDWARLFVLYSRGEILPMFNAGFMVFCNNTHKKIYDNWKKYVDDKNLPNPFPNSFPKEQIALSLALSGVVKQKDIGLMNKQMHGYGWNGENPNCDVYHTGSFNKWERIGSRIKRKLGWK
jgi:hypothetical protein